MSELAQAESVRSKSDVELVGQQRSDQRVDHTSDIAQDAIELGKAATDTALRQAVYIIQSGVDAAGTRPDASPYGAAIASNEALWLLWSGTTGLERDGSRIDDIRRLAMLVRADETLRPRMSKLRHPEDRQQLANYERGFQSRRDSLADKLAKTDVDVAVAATRTEDDELARAEFAAGEARAALLRVLAAHAKLGTLLSTGQAQVDDYVATWMETYPDLVEMPKKDIFKGRFSQGLTLLDTWYNGVCGVLSLKDDKARLAAGCQKGFWKGTATTAEIFEKVVTFTATVASATIVGTGALALVLGDKAMAHQFLAAGTKVCTVAGDIVNVVGMCRSAVDLYYAENFAEQRDAIFGMAPGAAVLLGVEGPVAIAALFTRIVTETLLTTGADTHRAFMTNIVAGGMERIAASRKQIALDAREWEVARELAAAPQRSGMEGAVQDAAVRQARIRKTDLIHVLVRETESAAHGAIGESFMYSAKHPGNMPAIKSRFGQLAARARDLQSRENVADREVEALTTEVLATLKDVHNSASAIAEGMITESAKNSIFDGAYGK